MSKHTAFWVGIVGLTLISLMPGCQLIQRILLDQKIIPPMVTLNRVEVKKDGENLGWWFYADNVDPTKGTKGDYGAPMALAFIFNIKNSNKVPVLLNEINFTVKIQNFKLDIIKSSEKMWIPPGMTNQLRVYSILNVQSARLNLLVQGGQNLLVKSKQKAMEKDQEKEEEKGNWLWRTLEEYWKGIPEFKFPVSVTDGAAVFEVKGVTISVPFNAVYHKEKKEEASPGKEGKTPAEKKSN